MLRSFKRISLLFIISVSVLFFSMHLFAQPAGADPEMGVSEDGMEESTEANLPQPEIIAYTSDGLTLKGYLYKPAGNGPFPAYMWNHGSNKIPGPSKKLAQFWLGHGFVFFAPIRHGHGDNPGTWIVDEEKALRASGENKKQLGPQIIHLHERESDDTVAAYQWLRKQPFVDAKRIVVGGGSYGGIQTVLMAERDAKQNLGVRCFEPMSPAAMSWGRGQLWGPRLSLAIQHAKAPIFLLQAENDFNMGPSQVLGPLVDAKGFPNRHKIFPPHIVPGMDPSNHQQGHGKFFSDPSAWQDDVLKYLKDCGVIQ